MRKVIAGVLCAFVGAVAFATATKAVASTITYTESALGSGSLNGVDFTGAAITMTGIADTTGQSFLSNQWENTLTSLTIDISGFAPVTYNGSIPAFAFANPNAVPATAVGLGVPAAPASALLATISSSLTGYQLVTAIGPVTSIGLTGSPTISTTGGDLFLKSVDSQMTFTATLSAPVPGPIVGAGLPGLMFAGAGLLGWLRWKRNAVSAV